MQIWYVGSAGDKVASFVGYTASLFVAPFLIAQVSPCVFLLATSKTLNSKQKILLFVVPTVLTMLLVSCFYLVLQYGV
jgi:hypothetical protein